MAGGSTQGTEKLGRLSSVGKQQDFTRMVTPDQWGSNRGSPYGLSPGQGATQPDWGQQNFTYKTDQFSPSQPYGYYGQAPGSDVGLLPNQPYNPNIIFQTAPNNIGPPSSFDTKPMQPYPSWFPTHGGQQYDPQMTDVRPAYPGLPGQQQGGGGLLGSMPHRPSREPYRLPVESQADLDKQAALDEAHRNSEFARLAKLGPARQMD